MVLPIESSLSPRDAARLEARNRAADIDVGLTPIRTGIPTGYSNGALLFLFGLREIRTGGRFVKVNSVRCVPRASIIWHGLKASPQIVNLVSTRIS